MILMYQCIDPSLAMSSVSIVKEYIMQSCEEVRKYWQTNIKNGQKKNIPHKNNVYYTELSQKTFVKWSDYYLFITWKGFNYLTLKEWR